MRAVSSALNVCFASLLGGAAHAGETPAVLRMNLDAVSGLQGWNARVEAVSYRGRRAVRLLPLPGREAADESILAIVTKSDFTDGTIEVDVAGAPRTLAPPDMRGFIGMAFRVRGESDTPRFECFYLRPTNARAADQLRRNHTVQYVSEPEFPWARLRQEAPSVYESYVDVEAGAWTHMKVSVSGTSARLFVNGAHEPCLVVNDLKQGAQRGRIALWSHSSTDGYFSRLSVERP